MPRLERDGFRADNRTTANNRTTTTANQQNKNKTSDKSIDNTRGRMRREEMTHK